MLAVFAMLCACAAALTPADRAGIADDFAKIEHCQEIGRACKIDGGTGSYCFGQYDACMKDAGLN